MLEVAAESWQLAPLEEDPFAAEAAGRLPCGRPAVRVEATWLEVTTEQCNYATLVHRFASDLSPGDVVRGEVAWATLAALEEAIGTLAFATEADGVVWSHEVAIPGAADITVVEFALPARVPAGGALYFHVRNHGYNAWQLSPLSVFAAGAER